MEARRLLAIRNAVTMDTGCILVLVCIHSKKPVRAVVAGHHGLD